MSCQLIGAFLALAAAILIGFYSVFIANGGSKCGPDQLKLWLVAANGPNNRSMQTVEKVFDRVGYCMVDGDKGEEWDVKWLQDFVFGKSFDKNESRSPHQLVNHFPSIVFLTNKMHLAVTVDSKYIPTSFDFPRLKNEFLYYKKLKLDKQFLVKNSDAGGIKIVQFQDMDFFLGETSFMQELVANPMLIDGRAFDLGVYVLVTSIDPLRMYRWKSDVHLRFCAEPYHPFDIKNVDKYVVSGNHLSIWDIQEFKEMTQTFNFSGLQAFNFHLDRLEHDVVKFWDQIDDAITSVTLAKLDSINRHMENYKKNYDVANRNFFELLRFDFLVDENANVHLMEVNTSPSLSPEKDERERIIYEQLLYNSLSTLGVLSRSQLHPKSIEESMMHSANKDIAVYPETCFKCIKSCSDASCELCVHCMANETIRDFHQAYREHQRRGEFRRVFPISSYLQENMSHFTKKNQLSVEWYNAKCGSDSEWC